MEVNTSPLMVTIRCVTYNHEPYIRECLEGFVMQKTNFRFEAIVHDDASTDGTANIIREYAEKYPDIIKPIFETENQYSKRDGSLRRIMNSHMKGKYIAMCEGDDCWIDPYKLQKQVDYLESHPECVYSCHRYYIYNEYTKEKYLMPNKYFDNQPASSEFTFDVSYPFLQEWITKTLTCVYRRDAFDTAVADNYKYYRDVHLVYHILSQGKGVCHSFIGGIYRKNSVGVYGSLSSFNQIKIDYLVYKEFYDKTHDPILGKVLSVQYILYCLKGKRFKMPTCRNDFKTLFWVFPNLCINKILKELRK